MTVIEADDMSALCERGAERRRVSTALLGRLRAGAHVLVHIDVAIRVLDAEEAHLIGEAIAGLEAAMRGESFEARFADLIDREPKLPDHLRDREVE